MDGHALGVFFYFFIFFLHCDVMNKISMEKDIAFFSIFFRRTCYVCRRKVDIKMQCKYAQKYAKFKQKDLKILDM